MGKFTDEFVFICDCQSTEHQIIFQMWKQDFANDDCRYVSATVHLIHCSFLKRLVGGIKYIFGHKSRFGNFDEFLFQPEDADNLQKVVDNLRSLQITINP